MLNVTWYAATLSSLVLHNCLSQGFCSFLFEGLISIPEKILDFEFWSSLPIICCAKMEGVLLGKWSRMFSKSCKLLTCFITEFECQVLGVENFVHSFYGANFWVCLVTWFLLYLVCVTPMETCGRAKGHTWQGTHTSKVTWSHKKSITPQFYVSNKAVPVHTVHVP